MPYSVKIVEYRDDRWWSWLLPARTVMAQTVDRINMAKVTWAVNNPDADPASLAQVAPASTTFDRSTH